MPLYHSSVPSTCRVPQVSAEGPTGQARRTSALGHPFCYTGAYAASGRTGSKEQAKVGDNMSEPKYVLRSGTPSSVPFPDILRQRSYVAEVSLE